MADKPDFLNSIDPNTLDNINDSELKSIDKECLKSNKNIMDNAMA